MPSLWSTIAYLHYVHITVPGLVDDCLSVDYIYRRPPNGGTLPPCHGSPRLRHDESLSAKRCFYARVGWNDYAPSICEQVAKGSTHLCFLASQRHRFPSTSPKLGTTYQCPANLFWDVVDVLHLGRVLLTSTSPKFAIINVLHVGHTCSVPLQAPKRRIVNRKTDA